MERKITNELIKWHNNDKPRPLILIGPRQVGKTYTALSFGKDNYKNTVYFNFDDNVKLKNLFDTTVGIENIILKLSKLCEEEILEKDTLIIFDEIHLYEKILPTLKYFNDSTKNYHIIAIGTYYDPITNTKKYSYPVGSVELRNMYSMDFEEFLIAFGKAKIIPTIYSSFKTNKRNPYHKELISLYEKYLETGGMPSAILASLNNENTEYINKNINKIIASDMIRNSLNVEPNRIKDAYDIISTQLLKKNKKYQYTLIRKGARSYEYEGAIDWLKQGGLIIKSIKLVDIGIPLSNYADKSNFKIYYKDSGLLSSKIGFSRNILIENNIASTLSINGFQLYFWESDGKASLDFIIQDKEGNIIPLDVKYPGVKSKSLSVYISRYNPPKIARVSYDNFSFKEGIKNIPVYALFCLKG